jgi:hypothetical protein
MIERDSLPPLFTNPLWLDDEDDEDDDLEDEDEDGNGEDEDDEEEDGEEPETWQVSPTNPDSR